MNEYTWKQLAESLLNGLRILFLMTVSWDFFLTLVSKASQRALVLTGVGSGYTPIIFVPWAFCLFVLALFVLQHLTRKNQSSPLKHGQFIYYAFIGLYLILSCIAFMNPLISWPLIINYLVNIVWAGTIIYFRHRMDLLDQK